MTTFYIKKKKNQVLLHFVTGVYVLATMCGLCHCHRASKVRNNVAYDFRYTMADGQRYFWHILVGLFLFSLILLISVSLDNATLSNKVVS